MKKYCTFLHARVTGLIWKLFSSTFEHQIRLYFRENKSKYIGNGRICFQQLPENMNDWCWINKINFQDKIFIFSEIWHADMHKMVPWQPQNYFLHDKIYSIYSIKSQVKFWCDKFNSFLRSLKLASCGHLPPSGCQAGSDFLTLLHVFSCKLLPHAKIFSKVFFNVGNSADTASEIFKWNKFFWRKTQK